MATAASCFQQEVDPSTRRRYQNESQWQADVTRLEEKEPSRPGLYELYKGYQVYKAESALTLKLRSDKRAHCYIGCRIANEVSVPVAEYAAWYKESEDLTDCNPKSLFEWNDIIATQTGIEMVRQQPGVGNTEFCRQSCLRDVNRR